MKRNSVEDNKEEEKDNERENEGISIHYNTHTQTRTSVIPARRSQLRQDEGMDTFFSSVSPPTVLPTFTSTREGT